MLTSDDEDPTEQLDYAGVMKLRTLLEANTPELFAKRVESGELPDPRRNLDPDYAHRPLKVQQQQVRAGAKSNSRIQGLQIEQALKDYRNPQAKAQKSVAFAMDTQTCPRFPEEVTQANISAGHYPRIPSEVLQQRLGESVKTMDDATRVANALGSLMTRVAVARNINAPDPEAEEEDSARREAPSVNSGTMTEGEAGVRRPPRVPEISFTKDMSFEDQRQLQELRQRSKSQNWSTINFAAN